MSYVNNRSYGNDVSYVVNMSYVCRLHELFKSCNLYKHNYELLKITWFLFFQNLEFNIYKNEKPKI